MRVCRVGAGGELSQMLFGNLEGWRLSVFREAPWSSGRTLALDAARPRSIPVGGENY